MTARGRFCWYELMTPDPAASLKFYRDVIGWTEEEQRPPPDSYTLLKTPEGAIAGVMPMPPGMEGVGPVWVGYVAVADVDDFARRLTTAGGTVFRPPTDIPGVGRFAVVADPQGATFNLFKGEGVPPPTAGPEKSGYVGWHELLAAHGATAFDFYETLFGWTKSMAVPMGEMGVYQLFAVDGVDQGGIMTKPPQAPRPYWGFYVQVEGAKAAIARLEKASGVVINGPHQVPGGQWTVQAQDPQGGFFNLVSVNA